MSTSRAQQEASTQQAEQLQAELHNLAVKLQQAEQQSGDAESQYKAQLSAMQNEHLGVLEQERGEAEAQLQQNLQALRWELQTAKASGLALQEHSLHYASIRSGSLCLCIIFSVGPGTVP